MNNLPAAGLVLGVVFLVLGGGAVLAFVAIESHHNPKAASEVATSTPSTNETSSGDATPITSDTSSTPSTGNSQTPTNVASTGTPDQPQQPSAHHQWTGGGPGGGGGGGQRGHMFDQLDLTADQQQQIQNIRATITDRQERREAIMKILTPDQQAKLEQIRAQMRAQHGGPGGGGGSQNSANPGTPAPH